MRYNEVFVADLALKIDGLDARDAARALVSVLGVVDIKHPASLLIISKLASDTGIRLAGCEQAIFNCQKIIAEKIKRKFGRCKSCGKKHSPLTVDPFASEVLGDDTPVYLCEDCQLDSAMEI